MLFCKKQVNQYCYLMNKINIIKLLLILVFITSCGYTPIFTNKNISFSIVEVETTGNEKLNKVLINNLNIYKNLNSEKKYYLKINTKVEKKITSKDSKGNPKTFEIKVITKTYIEDENNNSKEKIFIKSINYNNDDNKFELKKYENQSTKALVEKISEEVIIYLQTK